MFVFGYENTATFCKVVPKQREGGGGQRLSFPIKKHLFWLGSLNCNTRERNLANLMNKSNGMINS